MHASDVMTRATQSCLADDDLHRAAQIMWENDCGLVPVVDDKRCVVGVITDRDVCMAAYTQGRALREIRVATAMARRVHAVHENDPVELVESVMSRTQVRRVPVLDGDGSLVGILSIHDLARHARHAAGHSGNGRGCESVTQTLAAICSAKGQAEPANPARRQAGHGRGARV